MLVYIRVVEVNKFKDLKYSGNEAAKQWWLLLWEKGQWGKSAHERGFLDGWHWMEEVVLITKRENTGKRPGFGE